MFFAPLSKTPILQKSLFFFRKIAIFVGWSPHKSIKNRCKKDIKKNIEKKDSKIEFWPPCWPLKSSEIRKATWNQACFATLWKLLANRRKSTGAGVCKAS